MMADPTYTAKNFKLYRGDCMSIMPTFPKASVDLIAVDLPYGTTENPWDSILPLEAMWICFRHLIKPQGAIVLTASQPFTSLLVNSCLEMFKYEWIWVKSRPTGHVHAKNKPMKKHENVLVFSPGTTVHAVQSSTRMHYFPQGVVKHDGTVRMSNSNKDSPSVMGRRSKRPPTYEQDAAGYPASVLNIASEFDIEHPTQKPVPLMAYLVRSYTQPGDVVLDCCMGSGTTGVAAIGAGRRFVGIEKDAEYYSIAKHRIVGSTSPFDGTRGERTRARVRLTR
jgi:site-specific DNA-methyltransferase (adenine-specific)